MSEQVDLKDGGTVTRAWDGDGFRFEVFGEVAEGYVIIRPTRADCAVLARLFQDAAERDE